MAEDLAPPTAWSSAQTRAQFEAIAWLRWRILVNSFRRKGATGELVGRIILYLVFGSFVVGIVAGTGFATYFLVANGHLNRLSLVLWAIFILGQLLNIQLGQPGTTFDPTQLIRFPLRSRIYTAIRLFFGLLTPANIVGTLMALAVALAITFALPELSLYAFIAMLVFAATNVLFSRMVFAWVDRWLSTRRAREIFTGLIFAGSIGIQWANFTFNPAYNHHHTGGISPATQQRLHFVLNLYRHAKPLLAWLPPGLTATSLLRAHASSLNGFLGYNVACAAFAAVFLAVFALRMATEFRGEIFSDAANATPRAARKTSTPAKPPSERLIALTPATDRGSPTFGLPPVVLAVLGKEVLYLRRHMGLLYGLIMPIVLVLLLASKMASRSNASWVFPAAVAYTMLAIGPLSYNAFGLEGPGAQFYFLAPVRLGDVVLAKNLLSFLMALIEVVTVLGVVCYVAAVPPAGIAIATLLWAMGTLVFNATFGNRRSITTPKKVNPQRMANRQASQVSAFISLGIVLGSTAIAAAIFGLAFWFRLQWLLVPIFAVFAAAGLFFYIHNLRRLDAFAMDHREQLFLELCKQE
jgi:ABC-2 type transport system permease protein